MQINPDTIGFLIGITFCALVGAQAVVYLLGTTRQWATGRRVARMRLRVLDQELETATRRRQVTPNTSGSWKGFRRFVVKSAIRETASARSLYLVPQDRRPLPGYFPGQYLVLRFDVAGHSAPLVRCYSLSDRPRQEFYRCTIKALEPSSHGAGDGGVVSRFVNFSVQEGDVIEAQAPSGDFVMDLFERRPAILLAAGIGITPLLSMVQSVAHEQTGRQIILFYGVRNRDDHVFRDDLEAIVEEHPNIRVVTCYSRPLADDKRGRDYDVKGRLTVDLLRDILPSNNYEFFVCGPNPMMESVEEGLKEWGVPKHRIRSEKFMAAVAKTGGDQPLPASTSAQPLATIQLSPGGETLPWTDAEKSILETAEDQGITLPSSCRQGTCGTCMLALKKGSVQYESPPSFEPDRGCCLTCVARPDGNIELEQS